MPYSKSITILTILMLLLSGNSLFAQYSTFKLNEDGDTLNAIDKKGLKQGHWVESVGEIRGEPGYEEEGAYKDGKKHGYWRKYSLQGDLIAVENYLMGSKDGVQKYYNYLGNLEREESWRGYNPDAPYDTIPVYGEGSNEVLEMKIVKAEPYSVKDGDWKYYDPETRRLLRTETWERNRLMTPEQVRGVIPKYEKPKTVTKPKEMLEWEKKHSGKKGGFRDGATGM